MKLSRRGFFRAALIGAGGAITIHPLAELLPKKSYFFLNGNPLNDERPLDLTSYSYSGVINIDYVGELSPPSSGEGAGLYLYEKHSIRRVIK
jgi:hypothetical protein